MEVTDEVVKNVAELAQLEVPATELGSLRDGMQNILTLAEEMQAVDTADVAPVANPLDATQVLRADKVTETNQRELFQSVAPETENGLYLVPRVVE